MKFLARSLGLLLVAAGFIGLVIDGTRSIVNDAISFKTLSELVTALFPGGVPGLRASIAHPAIPWLWDPVMVHVLQFPASLTAFVLGGSLLWLGQKPLEPIGYLAGR
ncbi:PetM family of cytochrome b6f complex subunit 7 [Microvirga terricola]|uniref:PetM family of cytochrome b6f complex subunit 7 n=1 Tax=Microvirga terricola TaxID=2719797 RepID=A0ABX0VDL8_9HYPH|nr:PetM family of cytochrome b6f complex subunit 7 [Microvirga terricola]NIX75957.1 PetM family of cytochrome b6f complex subunit 7 [Microvirga terricola]